MKTINKYIALPLVLLMSYAANAGFWGGNNNCMDACAPVCCVAPLECGGFNLEFKAGVAPIKWTRHGRFNHGLEPVVNPCFPTNLCNTNNSCDRSCDVSRDCSISSRDCSVSNDCGNFTTCGLTPLANNSRISSFGDHHRVPVYIGLKLGYAVCNNVETFLEIDFIGAKNRCESRNHFRVITGYWGWRYYTDRCWNCVSFFVGSKVGIAHNKAMCNENRNNCLPCPITVPNCFGNGSLLVNNNAFGPRLRHLAGNVVTGGVQVGLDARVWCNLSFVFTAELVAFGQMKQDHRLIIPAPLVATTTPTFARFGHHGTQLLFPITFGLKWDF